MVSFQNDDRRRRVKKIGQSESETFHWHDQMIPMEAADVLSFGVFPGDSALGFDDVDVSVQDDMLQYVDRLDQTDEDRQAKTSRRRLQTNIDRGSMTRSGLDQILPLIAPCMALPGCRTTKVRQPVHWCRGGVLDAMEGYVVFRDVCDGWRNAVMTPEPRRATLQWIHDRWHGISSECAKPFVWVAFRDQVPAPKLSRETSKLHHACTAELKKRVGEMLDQLDVAIRDRLQPRHVPFKDRPSPKTEKRRPMQTMLDLHLFRALGLRE